MATSERTLHRRLTALVDESPKAFITRIRLETACVLLEGRATSIKRVALRSGYEDESSFRRAFFQFEGMSPSSYRNWAKQRLDAVAPSRPMPAHEGMPDRPVLRQS
ncbi:helix-turn-helix domain-containing protein [Cupriavidus lacunae]|uniref:HTH araC/xylS-type domain-containing protein n=1 Tax=Cupriavidus lacunae TaxID=2666307 RepID=A0A370NNR6_9BURK|nr:hypothetical protein DN412_27130 [Cupriavidus lacunae]